MSEIEEAVERLRVTVSEWGSTDDGEVFQSALDLRALIEDWERLREINAEYRAIWARNGNVEISELLRRLGEANERIAELLNYPSSPSP